MQPHQRRFQVTRLAARVLAGPVASYITRQRDRLCGDAVEIPSYLRKSLAPYFPADLLDAARVFVSPSLPIPALPYAAAARRIGLSVPSPDLISAITFDHVIASREPLSAGLAFHELVHVVQYRLLGVREFARQYVAGLLSARSYAGIPLEQCASTLERRFATEELPFDVEAAVTGKLS